MTRYIEIDDGGIYKVIEGEDLVNKYSYGEDVTFALIDINNNKIYTYFSPLSENIYYWIRQIWEEE